MRKIIFIAIVLMYVPTLYADTITLKDGRSFEADVIQETDEFVTVREQFKGAGDIMSDYKKVNIERIEKSTTQKKNAKRKLSQTVFSKHYEIVREEGTAHKAMGKNLSSYSGGELKDLPFIVRKEYRIFVPNGLSREEAQLLVDEIIKEKLEENGDIDEAILFFYDEMDDIDGQYTLGKAIWAVDGKLGEITPQSALSNDKSTHKIVLDIKGPRVGGLTAREKVIGGNLQRALWEDPGVPESKIEAEVADNFDISIQELNRIYLKYTQSKYSR